jgi:hypothetical protein
MKTTHYHAIPLLAYLPTEDPPVLTPDERHRKLSDALRKAGFTPLFAEDFRDGLYTLPPDEELPAEITRVCQKAPRSPHDFQIPNFYPFHFAEGFNAFRSFDSVKQALGYITDQPNPYAAFIAIVAANLEMEEKGFAADLIQSMPDFMEQPARQIDVTAYHTAAFSFDDTSAILGWTDGTFWNGWGKPIFEAESLRQWIEQNNERVGGRIFAFNPDGSVTYDPDGTFADDPDPENFTVEPITLFVDREKLIGYDLSHLGLAWNSSSPEEIALHYPEDLGITPSATVYPASLTHLRYAPTTAAMRQACELLTDLDASYEFPGYIHITTENHDFAIGDLNGPYMMDYEPLPVAGQRLGWKPTLPREASSEQLADWIRQQIQAASDFKVEDCHLTAVASMEKHGHLIRRARDIGLCEDIQANDVLHFYEEQVERSPLLHRFATAFHMPLILIDHRGDEFPSTLPPPPPLYEESPWHCNICPEITVIAKCLGLDYAVTGGG